MSGKTTIQLSRTTKSKLDSIKIHEKEPYDEVISRLIQEHKDNEICKNLLIDDGK